MPNQEQMTPNAHDPAQGPAHIPPTGELPTVPMMQGAPYAAGTPSASNAPRPWYKPHWIQSSQLPPRTVLIASLALLLILVSAGIAIGVSHIFAKPDGYLLKSNTNVTFIQFTEDQNDHLTGSLQSVYGTSDETVHSQSAAFTGIRNGAQLSLTFSALGFSATVQGTLDGDTLTLQMPDQNGYVATDVFHAASVSDYNTAASQLRRRITTAAAATQAAQATVTEQQAEAQATYTTQTAQDQAVTDANNQLSSDLATLNADAQRLTESTDFSSALSAYANDWTHMQKDYQQEQNDYQQGCGVNGYNASVVAYDASVVSYDLSAIQYDDSVFSTDVSSLNTTLQRVQSDLSVVQSDWQNLQAATAADNTGSVQAQFSQNDLDTAQANTQQQLDAANTALQKAQGQAQHYDQEAAQMNTAAQNLANSMTC